MSMNRQARPQILLVEDDENDVFFFERAVRKAEWAVELRVVRDGEAALECLRRGPAGPAGRPLAVDLLLLDLNLPVRHGLEVLRALREDPVLVTLPVVVLSSSASEADVSKAFALGAQAYFEKPRHPDDLVRIIELVDGTWLRLGLRPRAPVPGVGRADGV
jgi:CheY-like chemotaxis protein